MVRVLILTLLLSSCSTIEIVDGLCYNDREGTHLCDQDTAWELCEPWLTHTEDVWSNCMMMYS